MSNTDVIIITRGHVPGGAKSDIAGTLRDCYNKFGHRSPYKVEILVTETEGIRLDFLREERARLGIINIDDDSEVCSYNTWRGYPTLSVSVERLGEFSKIARQGALRHQAAHTVLHGTLEYNIFRISDDCKQIAEIKGISLPVLEQVLRNLSAAIKDCEVSKFLIAFNYTDCQAAFALEWIQSDARPAEKTVRMDRQTRFVYLVSLLKPLLLTHDLIAMPKSKKISLERQVLLGRKAEELIEHLTEYEQNKLLQITSTIADNLAQDTHNNVDSALHHVIGLA